MGMTLISNTATHDSMTTHATVSTYQRYTAQYCIQHTSQVLLTEK